MEEPPPDRPRASWEDLTPLGRAVVLGGALARGASWLAGRTAERAARIATDSTRAFREGRDGRDPADTPV